MVYVIGFDPATKSLAVSIVYYNLNITNNIQNLYNAYLQKKNLMVCDNTNINILLQEYITLLDAVQFLLQNKIKIIKLDVIDLIPHVKLADTTLLTRTAALHKYLSILDSDLQCCNTDNCIFVIEYQMGPNIKSATISAQIMYHVTKYANAQNNNIQLVGPTLKNKIIIGGTDAKYSEFIQRYNSNYACNKAHAKYNFTKLLQYLNVPNAIAHIPKKNHDDIADSVLMGLCYILTNCEF